MRCIVRCVIWCRDCSLFKFRLQLQNVSERTRLCAERHKGKVFYVGRQHQQLNVYPMKSDDVMPLFSNNCSQTTISQHESLKGLKILLINKDKISRKGFFMLNCNVIPSRVDFICRDILIVITWELKSKWKQRSEISIEQCLGWHRPQFVRISVTREQKKIQRFKITATKQKWNEFVMWKWAQKKKKLSCW